jgi:hypothetical protein
MKLTLLDHRDVLHRFGNLLSGILVAIKVLGKICSVFLISTRLLPA